MKRLLALVGALPHAAAFPLVVLGIIVVAICVAIALEGLPPRQGAYTGSLLEEVEQADKGDLKDVLEYRLADYRVNLDRFEANLGLQAVLVVVTVLLLVRRTETLKLFGNDVPLRWLHVFVPMMLTYYWLRFGFLLDELIESRIRGVGIARELFSEELAKSLFVDASFVDGWIMAFVDGGDVNYSGVDPSFTLGTAFFLVTILGSIAAANHASVLALVSAATRRYIDTRSAHWYRFYYSLPLIPLALIIASHFQFAYGGHNRNWLQVYVALVTAALMVLLHWLGIQTDQVRKPTSFSCLKRRRSVVHVRRVGVVDSSFDGGLRDAVRVALIGDSLSTAFHVDSGWRMMPKMWRAWNPSWFVSAPGDSSIESVDKRLSGDTNVVVRQHATPTAKIDQTGRSLRDLLTGTRHFSHQVDEVIIGRFPDILLLWIGHNSMNWREQPQISLEGQSRRFADSYEVQLRRLLVAASRSSFPSRVIVYGLVNFESFFSARAGVESRKKLDPSLYPYLEADYEYFESMKPEFREGMIRLALQCNEALRKMCRRLAGELEGSLAGLAYSDAMASVDIGDPDYLDSTDGWHPNASGHTRLADAAHGTVDKAVRGLFLSSSGGSSLGAC